MEVPIGEDAPGVVNAVIEIPKGSRVKYEMDESGDYIRVDRVVHAEMFFPANYGFVPETESDDGDPMDILVLASEAFHPYTVARARPIGVLKTVDESGEDPKLVSVAVDDPVHGETESHGELSDNNRSMITHFFQNYKELEEEKFVEIEGWEGPERAQEMIGEARE